MFRVNGKIERLLLFDPIDAKWQWIALSFLPCRTSRGQWTGGVGPGVRIRGQVKVWLFHYVRFLSMRPRKAGDLRQQTKQLARAVPKDLHTNAYQQKRGEL